MSDSPKRKPHNARKTAPKPTKAAMGQKVKKGGASALFDHIGMEHIARSIEAGKSLQDIAEDLGHARSTLWAWIEADPERSARAKAAREHSAEAEDDAALKAIQSAKTPVEVNRARAEAEHRRWRAKVRNPARYGDKVQIDADVSVRNADPEALRAELGGLLGLAAAVKPAEGE